MRVSYRASLSALCDDLAELHQDAGVLTAAERPAAIVARDAVLSAVADPCGDIAGVSATAIKVVTLDAVAQHPVAALRAMLDRSPTGFPELRPTPPVSPAGEAWSRAGVHASLMQRAWAYSDPDSRPRGAARWTALADLAAIVEAVTLLDRDVVPDPTATAALPAGLRIAAREVRLLATAEDLPAMPELRPSPTKPVRVGGLHDIAGSQVRLISLLTSAEHVDPISLRNVAHAHRHTVAVLCSALNQLATGDPRLREVARAVADHARVLDLGRDRGVATIWRGDPRPLAQAKEIEGAAMALHQRGRINARAQPAILAAVQTSVRVTEAIAVVADAQLQAGKWLVPDPKAVALRWVAFGSTAEPPRTATILHRAREHGRTIENFGLVHSRSAHPPTAGLASARLSGGLSSTVHRPYDPAIRPGLGRAG